jgi:hypothetical protein
MQRQCICIVPCQSAAVLSPCSKRIYKVFAAVLFSCKKRIYKVSIHYHRAVSERAVVSWMDGWMETSEETTK